jgi:PEGA domain-containing protein
MLRGRQRAGEASQRATAVLAARRARLGRVTGEARSRLSLGAERARARTVEALAPRAEEISRLTRRAARGTRSARTALVTSLRASAVPAALLVVLALFATTSREPPPRHRSLTRPARVEEPAPVRVAVLAPAPPPVDVHVNARPWARVWIDGVDLGATPLRHALTPGRHQLAAVYPGGRRVAREIEIDAQRRFVALP